MQPRLGRARITALGGVEAHEQGYVAVAYQNRPAATKTCTGTAHRLQQARKWPRLGGVSELKHELTRNWARAVLSRKQDIS